jgi:hypothetical protein
MKTVWAFSAIAALAISAGAMAAGKHEAAVYALVLAVYAKLSALDETKGTT